MDPFSTFDEDPIPRRRTSRPWWNRNIVTLAVALFVLVWARELGGFAPKSAWLSVGVVFLIWFAIPNVPKLLKNIFTFIREEFWANRFWKRIKLHPVISIISLLLFSYILSFVVLKGLGVRRAQHQGCCSVTSISGKRYLCCSYTLVNLVPAIGEAKINYFQMPATEEAKINYTQKIYRKSKAHMSLVDFYSPLLYLECFFLDKHRPIHIAFDKNTQPYSFASPDILNYHCIFPIAREKDQD